LLDDSVMISCTASFCTWAL